MAGPRTVDKSAAENPGEHHYLAIGLCTLGHSQPRDPTYPVTGGRLVTIAPALRLIVEQPGHDSPRAALIYQHASSGADRAIADALDLLIEATEGPANKPSVEHYQVDEGTGQNTDLVG
jgi:hypothetical protein